MRALSRKALRDLWHLRGQALAICLVIASGIATFVTSLSALHSLEGALDAYYERYRFGDVFTHLERAPQALAARLEAIPGVARAETRIVEMVTLDMPGMAEPAIGRLVSLPPRPQQAMHALHLRAGRFPERSGRHEVLVSEAFAQAHGLVPGSTVQAILNGRLERFAVTGVALSPEFIYQIREGEMLPDDRRFGVFWMPQPVLAAAFDMEGAFNDVAIDLMPGASEAAVIERLDRLTARYGSLGAYGRADQLSHKFVSNEIRELRGMTAIVPVIFLAVAAFLLNVVLSRLVSTQRGEIACLKAMGYSRHEIGWHYAQIVLALVLAGTVLGIAAGAWMGSGLTHMYARFFHFPIFEYRLRPSVAAMALGVSSSSAFLGAFAAVAAAVRLPPAEAMRPQPPATYRPALLERAGLSGLLSPAARMILRQLERRPMRAILSGSGVALATAILVLGNFMEDGVEHVLHQEFTLNQRQDLSVSFVEATMPQALAALRQMRGVTHAEPVRGIPARLRVAHRARRVGVSGLVPDGELLRLHDARGQVIAMPDEGLVLSEKLAEILHVRPGEEVTVEVLEGERPVRRVPVTALVDDFSGVAAYMHIHAANRLMREEGLVSGAFLSVAPDERDRLYRQLKHTPQVAAVTLKDATVQSFRQTLAETILLMKTFNVAFAVVIACGVVYNTARISLSERSRELATLRVIGFSRREISLIQLGELAVLTLLGIPAGLVMGYVFAAWATSALDTELFRMPLVIERSTYAFAALVVITAAVLSGLIVRRMLDRLNLIAVLKSSE